MNVNACARVGVGTGGVIDGDCFTVALHYFPHWHLYVGLRAADVDLA